MFDKRNLIERFQNLHIAVFGDLMLDKYIFGKVERISPEAPIPIVSVQDEKYVLGGAANVAANIASLHAKAYLFGQLGVDSASDLFLQRAHELEIDTAGIFCDETKHTIQKIRVIGQHQQLLRIDYEDEEYLETNISDTFLKQLSKLPHLDAILISDYAKGTITSSLIHSLIHFAQQNHIPIMVDPKPKHKLFYQNVSLITPNLKEAQELSGLLVDSLSSLEQCGRQLNDLFQCDIIITTGEKGMSIFPLDAPIQHIPTHATEVFDVSGAGDTVIATLSLAICAKMNLSEAAHLANLAAGIKVQKLGTTPVKMAELLAQLDS